MIIYPNLNRYRVEYHHLTPAMAKRWCYIYAISEFHAKEIFYDGYSGVIDNVVLVERGTKKMIDLTKKMSITLNEDDIKEIIADYVSQQVCDKTRLTKENVSFEYGVREFGTQREPDRRPYIKECVIKV